MRIKVLTPFRHEGQKFETDEVRMVDDQVGAYFCRAGWVEDLEGNVATESPDPRKPVYLHPDSVRQKVAVGDA